jgi:polyisoprenyl-teichoic acid--peptidoglycan teichoic acid transferase
VGVMCSLALAGSAVGLAYVYRKYERLPRVELGGALEREVASGEPGNYLIVGVDNAGRLDAGDPVRVGRDDVTRSDTIMILRIEPGRQRASLLSLPRDLWVPVPGTSTSQRINILIDRGGPQLLVRAIHEYLGIPINHYVQVDFAAFRGLVDAVGGVPVYFPHPARDRRSGLLISEPGCTTLDATQALAYVRSRYHQELIDGEWVDDPLSDLSRIRRQQDFVRRALTRAVSRARNPGTLDQLIDVGLEGIAVDDELTADDIFSLGQRFSSFDPDSLVTYSVPATPDTVGRAEILRLDEDGAEPILARFRPVTRSEDVAPASVRLRVENGSGITGQAGEAARELSATGFGLEGIADAASFGNERTILEHGPGQQVAADAVARWLVAGAELRETDSPGLVLVTGADWSGVRTEPRASTTVPAPEESAVGDTDGATGTGEAGDAGEGRDGGTPTTTFPGLDGGATVPSDDPAARAC